MNLWQKKEIKCTNKRKNYQRKTKKFPMVCHLEQKLLRLKPLLLINHQKKSPKDNLNSRTKMRKKKMKTIKKEVIKVKKVRKVKKVKKVKKEEKNIMKKEEKKEEKKKEVKKKEVKNIMKKVVMQVKQAVPEVKQVVLEIKQEVLVTEKAKVDQVKQHQSVKVNTIMDLVVILMHKLMVHLKSSNGP